MSRFLAERYQSMKPYTPGEQPRDKAYIKLNTNELPYLPSPKVMAAVTRAEVEDLRLYSDPTAKLLVEEVANYYGVRPGQVFVGNGSDEVLAFCFIAFCGAEKGICFPDISYGFYPVYANLFGVDYKTIPLQEDWSLDYKDYFGAGRVVLIANPNAPTGLSIPLWQVEEILKANPDDLVIMDEAYVDFGGESALPLVKKYDNLMVIHTFSNSRAMAGARLGYAIASEALIEDLNKIKFSFNPYNVDRLAIVAGAAAVSDGEYLKECCQKVIATRTCTRQALGELGFEVLDSKTNFLFMTHPQMPGETYAAHLRNKGILVRYFGTGRTKEYVRMSIGTDSEMAAVITATKEILREAGI